MNKLLLAEQLFRAGRLEQAEVIFRQLLADEPDNLKVIRMLIRLYEQQGNVAQHPDLLSRAIELDPADVDLNLTYARVCVSQERFDLAEQGYLRVLESEPEHIGALIALSKIRQQTVFTDKIATMQALFRQPDLSLLDRRRLAFALGKVFDDLAEYDRAFEYFEVGNSIARKRYRNSAKAEQDRCDEIKRVFDAEFFRRHANAGRAEENLIYLIGMPRSGTTLVEQILASHQQVQAAGEAAVLHRLMDRAARVSGKPFPSLAAALNDSAIQQLAQSYLGELRHRCGVDRSITDKTLGSEQFVGLIHVMLPNAKIIYCARDPRDQGLSFYQQDFGDQQPFSYSLADIGHYYNRCKDMMEYWSRILPNRIFRIRYEDIVADLEASVRRLLEHCGLPYDSACLAFHQTERIVGTASHMQVRRPLYDSSVGRWKRYERQLQPLIEILEE